MTALKTLGQLKYKKTEVDPTLNQEIEALCAQCYQFMGDDFNTPRTIATLFDLVGKINAFEKEGEISKIAEETNDLLNSTFSGMVVDVLGLNVEETGNEGLLDETLQMLVNIRQEAKQHKNFALSDKIRDELSAAGVQLKDSRDGTTEYIIN
jgi:cysteinyl-tRNA synthetase